MQVTDRPTSETVAGMVKQALSGAGLTDVQLQRGLVGIGADGASVMQGKKALHANSQNGIRHDEGLGSEKSTCK